MILFPYVTSVLNFGEKRTVLVQIVVSAYKTDNKSLKCQHILLL